MVTDDTDATTDGFYRCPSVSSVTIHAFAARSASRVISIVWSMSSAVWA